MYKRNINKIFALLLTLTVLFTTISSGSFVLADTINKENSVHMGTSLSDGQIFVCKAFDTSSKLNFTVDINNGAVDDKGKPVAPEIYLQSTSNSSKNECQIKGWLDKENNSCGNYRNYNAKTKRWDISIDINGFLDSQMENTYAPYKIRIEGKAPDGTSVSIEKQVYAMYKTQFYKPAGTAIISIEQSAIDKSYYLMPQTAQISMGETVGILIEKLLGKDKIKIKGSSIKQDTCLTGLYQKNEKGGFLQNGDYGPQSQWIVSINGTKVNSVDKNALNDGDVVRIMFSKDGGTDVGFPQCNKTDTSTSMTKLFQKVFQVQGDKGVNNVPEVKNAIIKAKQYLCGNGQTVEGIKEQLTSLEKAVNKVFPQPEINEKGNYILDSPQDLVWMQYCSTRGEQFQGKTFLMARDIDMKGSRANVWHPLATSFRGTINGQGYKLYNVYMNGTKADDQISFFGDIAADGEIRNVGIDATMEISGGAKGAMFAFNNGGLISRCYTSGNIQYGNLFDGAGFVYDNTSTALCTDTQYIKDCYSDVEFVPMSGIKTVKGTACGFTSVAAYDKGFGKLMNVLALGNIPENISDRCFFGNESAASNKVGIYGNSHIYLDNALFGKNNTAYCAQGRTTLELKKKTTYPGFNFNSVWNMNSKINKGYPYLRVFETHEEPLTKSVMASPVMEDKPYDRSKDAVVKEVKLNNVENGDQVGVHFETVSSEIQGQNVKACRPGGTDIAAVKFKTLYLTGKDADKYELYPDAVYSAEVKTVENQSKLPYDSAAGAYTISSLKDFKQFTSEYEKWNSFAGKKIKLMADIDLSGKQGETWKPMGDKMKVVSPSWCGNNDYVGFSGELDGNGHTISGLHYDTASEFQDKDNKSCCFFEEIEASGVVKNLKLVFSGDTTDKNSNRKNIATLTGKNEGIIYDCEVRGSVNNKSETESDVYAFAAENNGKIENCYADIRYKGTLKGPVGKGTLENCCYAGVNQGKNLDQHSQQLDRKYWDLNNPEKPVLKLFAGKDAKPVVTLGLDIQLNQKYFDRTTGAAISNIQLTGLENQDKKNVWLNYQVKSAAYDSPASGMNKKVTVTFDKLELRYNNPELNLKYELLPTNQYVATGDILSRNSAPTAQEKQKKIAEIKKALFIYYKDIIDNRLNTDSEYDPNKGDEWIMMDLAYINEFYPVGKEEQQKIDDYRKHYVESLRAYMETHAIPNNDFKSTKYDRILMAMTAMGYNPEDFVKSEEEKGSKFDFIGTISDKNFGQDGQFMGACYGLMAMDSGNYAFRTGSQYATREELIKRFTPKADFYLPQNTTVSDFVSMPMQSAAPYAGQNWENVISQLSGAQQWDGRFGNIWTTDQVVILLSALGVNLLDDTRFIKDGESAIDAILKDGFDLNNMKITQPSLSNQHAEALISVMEVEQGRNGAWWLFDKTKAKAYKDNNAITKAATGKDADKGNITVTFRLIGDTQHDGFDKHQKYVNWVKTTSYKVTEGSTVYDIFMKAVNDNKLSQKGAESGYIKSVKAPLKYGGYWLGEFDNNSPNSGWMFTINGQHPNSGIKGIVLKDSDQIIMHYVDDYTKETIYTVDGQEQNHPAYPDRWLEAADQ